MDTERRSIGGEVRMEERDGKRFISGYAATFYRADDPGTEFSLGPDFVERIMPGAFRDAIARDDVRGLFNHDSAWLLGRNRAGTLTLAEDERGLRYSIEYNDQDSQHRDVRQKLERGDLDGSSFAFTVPDGGQSITRDGSTDIREIRAVNLYDVGPVTYPAYGAATSQFRGAYEVRDAAFAAKQQAIAVRVEARRRELLLDGYRDRT